LRCTPIRTTTKTLKRFLADKLHAPGTERKLRKDLRIRVPILQKEIDIPFGFQNVRFNLISPVRFESANPDQSSLTACKYAVEGRSLFDNRDPNLGELQLVIVGKFRPKDRESVSRVRRVFKDDAVKLFKTSELPQLVDEIRRTGKEFEDNAKDAG
jgi:hypothetical protein